MSAKTKYLNNYQEYLCDSKALKLSFLYPQKEEMSTTIKRVPHFLIDEIKECSTLTLK